MRFLSYLSSFTKQYCLPFSLLRSHNPLFSLIHGKKLHTHTLHRHNYIYMASPYKQKNITHKNENCLQSEQSVFLMQDFNDKNYRLVRGECLKLKARSSFGDS